jgi:hypothetical protein
MNIKLTTLAVAALAIAPVTAFAQSAPAPINQAGPGVTAPVSSPTDTGIAGQSGNTFAVHGGVYTTQPRAAVVAPGYESYASVQGSDWANRGHYTVPGSGWSGAYSGSTVGYGGYED